MIKKKYWLVAVSYTNIFVSFVYENKESKLGKEKR